MSEDHDKSQLDEAIETLEKRISRYDGAEGVRDYRVYGEVAVWTTVQARSGEEAIALARTERADWELGDLDNPHPGPCIYEVEEDEEIGFGAWLPEPMVPDDEVRSAAMDDLAKSTFAAVVKGEPTAYGRFVAINKLLDRLALARIGIINELTLEAAKLPEPERPKDKRRYRVLAPVHVLHGFVVEASSVEEARERVKNATAAELWEMPNERNTAPWVDVRENLGDPVDVYDVETGKILWSAELGYKEEEA